ncbi:hypothetical protein BGW42_004406 [Actinomortierella wolfii]|nr:hypothetical protein BGW42_004406 [Actinomortierella wolfii]
MQYPDVRNKNNNKNQLDALILGSLIGSGAYGSVYRGQWAGQPCAAKRFFATQAELEDSDIQKEISILQTLRHRHIIQFFRTLEHDDGFYYLIMDLADNGSLESAIKRGDLDWKTKYRIAHEVARGLEYIHHERILHRDLKSANVLLSRDYEVKLADFGLAEVKLMSASRSSESDRLSGTLRWMAPELFDVRPRYSSKSDVYALGMVMWEMAANSTRPYKDHNDNLTIMALVKSGEREDIPDDTPRDFRQWIERCWHQDRNQRPKALEIHLIQTESIDQVLVDDGEESISLSASIDDYLNDRDAQLGLDKNQSEVVSLLDAAQKGDSEAQIRLGNLYKHGQGGAEKSDSDAVAWYRKAAEQGVAQAQFNLGKMYDEGLGIAQSDTEAVTWYRKAADQGNASAQYSLGSMFEKGRGVELSSEQALNWYRKAADQGNSDAQLSVGISYHQGTGVPQNDTVAVDWFRKAAEQGHPEAQRRLAEMYFTGKGVDMDLELAANWYRQAAHNGNAKAQNQLAIMYEQGKGVPKSHIDAAAWYRKAAIQGLPAAQCNMGLIYKTGRGVKKNLTESVEWYRKAVEQGHAGGQCGLGNAYMSGLGVEVDGVKAVHFLELAAAQDHTLAQNHLGYMYLRGVAVEKNYEQALRWFRLTAAKGDWYGNLNLGTMYARGLGVPQSDKEAFPLFLKAAEKGSSEAQYNVGLFYQLGRSVEKNDELAIEWFEKAEKQGNTDARDKLNAIKNVAQRNRKALSFAEY